MAFHGGLETGTAEMARTAASASGASLYLVEQPPALRWHVPSHAVDPAESDQLGPWLRHVETVVSLHGYGRVRQPRRILLGGRNRPLAARLAEALVRHPSELAVVTDLEDMPTELRGLHRDNPVNRPARGGVQMELPPSARDRRLGDFLPELVEAALVELVEGYEDAG